MRDLHDSATTTKSNSFAASLSLSSDSTQQPMKTSANETSAAYLVWHGSKDSVKRALSIGGDDDNAVSKNIGVANFSLYQQVAVLTCICRAW